VQCLSSVPRCYQAVLGLQQASKLRWHSLRLCLSSELHCSQGAVDSQLRC